MYWKWVSSMLAYSLSIQHINTATWCIHTCTCHRIPYSGKFSPGKNFAKPRCVVLRENFARFIFAHMRLGEIKFHGIIAERLSARQLILHRISASVCIYIYIYIYMSRLGMQLTAYCAWRGRPFCGSVLTCYCQACWLKSSHGRRRRDTRGKG